MTGLVMFALGLVIGALIGMFVAGVDAVMGEQEEF